MHETAQRECKDERGSRERDDVRGGALPRRSAVEPEAEAEKEERREPEQVPLREPPHVARGEEPDLGDEAGREGEGHREVRANLRRVRARERQRGDGAGRDDADEQKQVGGVVQGEAQGIADGVLDGPGRFVRAEPDRQDDHGDGGERGERRPQAGERRCRSSRGGVDRDREHEGGHEHDALEPGQDREHDDSDEQSLRPPCRLGERARRKPGRQRDQGVESRLAHQQPGVREPRDAERERGGGERPAFRHQRPAPGEDRHGGERHRERPQDPREVVAERGVEERERKADQRGVDEAVERCVGAQDREPAGLPETSAELRVDDLVGGDPRCGDAQARDRARDRRNRDQRGQDPPGRNPPHGRHDAWSGDRRRGSGGLGRPALSRRELERQPARRLLLRRPDALDVALLGHPAVRLRQIESPARHSERSDDFARRRLAPKGGSFVYVTFSSVRPAHWIGSRGHRPL